MSPWGPDRLAQGSLPPGQLHAVRPVRLLGGGRTVHRRVLGWFHYRITRGASPDDGIELGYRLCRDAWGNGYATEGSRALIRKGFTEYDVARVYAHTMAVNLASRRVLEKSGLTYLRTFPYADPADPIEGAEHGEVEYVLTRAEWAARTPGANPGR